MIKINTLVAEIKGQLSDSLKNRIEKLKELETKLEAAKTLNETTPSDANQQAFDDLNDSIIDFVEDLEAQLKTIIEAEKETPPAPAPAPTPTPEAKTKSSNGVLGIVVGLAVFGLTLGAVNYFKNK